MGRETADPSKITVVSSSNKDILNSLSLIIIPFIFLFFRSLVDKNSAQIIKM